MGSLRERIKRLRSSDQVQEKTQSKPEQEEQQPKKQSRKPRKQSQQQKYSVQKQKVSLSRDKYQELKLKIHRKLLDALDLSILSELEENEVKNQIRQVVGKLMDQAGVGFNRKEREQFVQEIVDEVVGFGPLEPLLHDSSISDILVNGAKQVYVEREGKLYLTDVEFKDNDHLRHVMDRIVSTVGRHIDESSPMCDARLPDGSRVNAVIPPLAVDYPVLSIRKFRVDALSMEDLLNYGTITEEIGQVCAAFVRARLNVLISGGTGAGKTTTLNILSACISPRERIVTIEDSAELQLQQPHVVRMETRPPNIEGKGEVTQYDLLINSLRMRPDRIILGEVRGREALDMLQAMNTGHDGSMCTIHANTPRDALTRLETMVAMGGFELPQMAVRQQMSSALDVIIQMQRLSDGSRRMTYMAEVTGMEGEVVTMQDIFRFERKGLDEDGNVRGQHVATGVQPRFLDRLRAGGINLPPDIFMPS
ncbi:MAG: CpaF family protein [Candidatus Brocadiia bacterium]